ncbi:MAG: transcriptional regulator [Candidatus Pacebacteria bacterium]|jgi:TrpR family transcriptional regulator, trp operon repressor|nr:transcriptional regulator [Candidatus Paceibacterota bacterium]MBT3511873.1 transcriptional regulator [Candidatus Paceibacterota bacterium]MBT4005360.1 transcriptional regulator [Candidatus Paceibacterota bacterium]MBT4359273.1 transcriptional regulator [Candidatus Paceibacterota bacterium]MBT4680892.1 transcriptional regulator [Candidatus Paceibacterota bacterium]
MNNKEFDELVKALLSIEDKKSMQNFLFGLLTKKELEDLPNRLQIIKMLKEGIPQREIAKKLGVGIATVTRGSKEIDRGTFKNV